MIEQVLETAELLISEATGQAKSLSIPKLDPTRTAFTTMKAALAPGTLDRMALFRESLSMQRTVQSTYNSMLNNIFNQYQTGNISGQVAMTRFRSAAQVAYQGAFHAGTLRAGNTFYKELGLTGYDKRFGSLMRNIEAKYFKGFMGDMTKAGYPADRLLWRLGMYKQALASQYWNGYVAGLPEGTYIAWVLSMSGTPSVEHCPDCESLAANSPYLREALPTVPKSGDTQCMTMCYCGLKEITRGEAIQSGLIPPGVGATRDEMLGRVGCTVYGMTGEVIGGDIATVFNDMFNEINRLRQLIELDAANVEKYIKARSALVRQSRTLAETYGVRVIPKYAVKDLVAAVRSIASHGWEYQNIVGNFTPGLMVYDVRNTLLNAGVVTRIEGDTVYVMTTAGEVAISVNKGLLFMRESDVAMRPFRTKYGATRGVEAKSGAALTPEKIQELSNTVKAIIEELPVGHSRFVKEVMLVTKADFIERGLKHAGVIPVGSYNSFTNRLSIRYDQVDLTKENLRRIIFHEVAHSVTKEILGKLLSPGRNLWKEWHMRAVNGVMRTPSSYALTDYREFFAENYSYYMTKGYPRIAPEIKKWFDNNLGGL